MGYLLQAGRGQLEFFNRAVPLEAAIRDERTPERTRGLLAMIPGIKAYAETYGIKPTRNYRKYVKLDRDAAVYVVSACDPLEFKSKEWAFPVVGRFPYLGYFDLGAAQKLGQSLREEGYDADVRGAGAYSTLGWFDDPVLSTMIPPDATATGALVNVVIHESVHATLYLPGQSTFNESLANFVADRLTLGYLDARLKVDSVEKAAYLESEARSHVRVKRLHSAYRELAALYATGLSREDKLAKKAEVLDRLKKDLQINRDLNNATLVQFKSYHEGAQDFAGLLAHCASNWKRFFKALHTLREQSFSRAQESDLNPILRSLQTQKCPEL